VNRIGIIGATLLTLVVVLLSGCSSGQTASSDPLFSRTRTGLDSVDGQVGGLRLLGVAIASPGGRGSLHIAGDSAALLLTIANDGSAEDLLTGVRAEAAQQVVLRTGDASPDPNLHVAVAPGAVAVLREVTGPHLELSGLRETLVSGFSVPVTFQFRDAGSLTLEVPVRTYTDVRPDRFSTP
jgi:copper(I)-binding protein